ncbi:tyrosinase family oxidase copper chaperone [Streptomyces lincolnensis]|uniref:tyrosinase family oxidase copper chaperone n=1 Tax=Streptomyces lincolnensis TaxID=1915 RepID=UPI0037D6130C
MKRREVIAGAAAVAAVGAVPAVAGYRGAGAATTADATAPRTAGPATVHTERYEGRTIRVADHGGTPVVTIDGRELHLMRLGDDAFVSALCHYEMSTDPLQAARRAVRELRGAQLLPLGHSGTHQA